MLSAQPGRFDSSDVTVLPRGLLHVATGVVSACQIRLIALALRNVGFDEQDDRSVDSTDRPLDILTMTDLANGQLLRYTAFATDPRGGNPAGVWIGDKLPDRETMQAIAKEVGYSETAFISPATGARRTVRYFSPEMEVTFCGHATIGSGVALAAIDGPQKFLFDTLVGEIEVDTRKKHEQIEASLTSVEPTTKPIAPSLLTDILETLGWSNEDVDLTIPPILAYAGAWHVVIALVRLETLSQMTYDFDRLRALMEGNDITTCQLVHRESETHFHSRNPFPVGGVVEDPATGAAAAALGGYLRQAHLVSVPTDIVIRQGEAMGRPSVLNVHIPTAGGIVVSGAAMEIAD